MATSEVNGQVSVRSASLGWFSAPRLNRVEIRDQQGERVAEIPEVSSNRSLLGLLTNTSKLGRFRLVKPTFHLVLHEDGSNLEEVLANYLKPKTEPTPEVDVAVEILDGTVSIIDPRIQRTWQVEKFQLAVAAPQNRLNPVLVQLSGEIADDEHPARFDLSAKVSRQSSQDTAGSKETPDANQVKLRTETFPLRVAAPVLTRFVPGLELDGRLTSSLECSFDAVPIPQEVKLEGRLLAEELLLATPMLGSDRVRLNQLDTNCRVAWQKQRVNVDQLTAESDVGNVSITGSVDLSDRAVDNLLTSLPQQTFTVDGQLDLAKLAEILPGTLRIREGTRVTSGQLQVALASQRGRYGMTWEGKIEATELRAENRGRKLTWQQPILVNLSARETKQGPVVEKLKWRSDFLSIEASGTPDRISANADFDLGQFSSRLNSYVDLGDLKVTGVGGIQLHWSRTNEQQFRTHGDFEVRDFELIVPDRPRWKEEKLTAAFTAAGKTDFTSATQLDAAEVDVRAGSDQLVAKLAQPVVDLHDGGIWTVQVDSQGQLAQWLPRLSPWLTLKDWKLGGTYKLAALATASATAVRISESQISVGQLRAEGPGLNLVEPAVELALAGSWDGRRRRLECSSANLAATSLSALAKDMVFSLSDQGRAELTGKLSCNGRLEQVQKWFAESDKPADWEMTGAFSSWAKFQQLGSVISGNVDAKVNNLTLVHRSGQKLHETQVRFAGQGSYDNAARTLYLSKAELTSGAVAANLSGQLAKAKAGSNLQLEGELDCDLEKLSNLLKSQTGGNVVLTGRSRNPFSYQGPLTPEKARGQAALGWDWGDVYGFRVGQGRLDASLSDGRLQIRPVNLTVSEGRVLLAPEVRFADKTAVLVVPPGRLVDRVRINPRMCSHFLQYVAPVLAGVTTAEGAFSVDIDGCQMPLGDLESGELAGRMTVHTVNIGPGPLIREMAVLLGREKAASLKRESVIEFRMVDGRVYHRGLELAFPDVTVRTYGSVGLDKSLAIMAEMPVPPKWKVGGVLGSALRNQTIRVPITGTLDKPKIDQKVFDQIQAQLMQKATQNVLEDELSRGLERLFRSNR
jgi:hypothetical protein